MGIQINGQTDTVTAIDGSITVGTDLTVPGVLTYDDVTNIDSIGVVTARSGINIGTGVSITSPSDNILALGTNNTERLRISGIGSVGIGTNVVPQGNLHLSSGTSGDCVLIIEADTDNNEETDHPYIEFRQDGGLAHSKVGLEDNELVIANSVISGEGIVFKVGQSSTPGWQQATERVSIGTSETVCTGFYRATNIPFMSANGSPSVATGSGAENVTNFANVRQNANFNSYDNSTGIYKVPVNGLYWASAAITCTHTPSGSAGTLISLTHSGPGASGGATTYGANYPEAYITMSAAGVFNCLAGDEIKLRLSNGTTIFTSTPRNYFSVAFLG